MPTIHLQGMEEATGMVAAIMIDVDMMTAVVMVIRVINYLSCCCYVFRFLALNLKKKIDLFRRGV